MKINVNNKSLATQLGLRGTPANLVGSALNDFFTQIAGLPTSAREGVLAQNLYKSHFERGDHGYGSVFGPDASISTNDGFTIMLDKADYDRLSGRKFKVAEKETVHRVYHYAQIYHDGNWVNLGRFLLGLRSKDRQVSFLNGDGTDCRRHNLEACTPAQASYRRRKYITNNRSIYKGVRYNKRTKKYHAFITKNYVTENLGAFDTEQEAACARDLAATTRYGKYGRYNVASDSRLVETVRTTNPELYGKVLARVLNR